MHMDIWINCDGLTVRTGTAAVGCEANGGGDVGVSQKVGQSWGKIWSRVRPELGQKVKPSRKWLETPQAELGSRTSDCRVAK